MQCVETSASCEKAKAKSVTIKAANYLGQGTSFYIGVIILVFVASNLVG
jgi:hypothetical protein